MRVIGSTGINPSDTENVPKDDEGNYPDAVFAAGAGDVALELYDGSQMTITLTAGQERPYSFRKVLATGTTATGIRGLFLR